MAFNKVTQEDGTVLLDLTQDTVQPNKMLSNVTAHNSAGEPIIGTIRTLYDVIQEADIESDDRTVSLKPSFPQEGVYVPGGTKFHLYTKVDKFGDATSDDVAAGKTFTSAAGFKVVGTRQTRDEIAAEVYDEIYDEIYTRAYDDGYSKGHDAGLIAAETLLHAPFIIQGRYIPVDATKYIPSTKITDLTNTTWKISSGWTVPAGYGTFELDFNVTVHNTGTTNYTAKRIHLGYTTVTPLAPEGGDLLVEAGYIANNILVSKLGFVDYREISNVYAFTITFTGGNAVSNTNLINWLYTYGELQGEKGEKKDVMYPIELFETEPIADGSYDWHQDVHTETSMSSGTYIINFINTIPRSLYVYVDGKIQGRSRSTDELISETYYDRVMLPPNDSGSVELHVQQFEEELNAYNAVPEYKIAGLRFI